MASTHPSIFGPPAISFNFPMQIGQRDEDSRILYEDDFISQENSTNEDSTWIAEDSSDEENEPETPQRRRSPRTTPFSPQPPFKASSGLRRVCPGTGQEFDIFQDKTAQVNPPVHRGYYGSSVPYLGDITNGKPFVYIEDQMLRKWLQRRLNIAYWAGRRDVCRSLHRNMQRDYVALNERVQGLYYWHQDYDHMDVWLWVQAHNYHKGWTSHQQDGFKQMLGWMDESAETVYTCLKEGDKHTADHLEENMAREMNRQFTALGIKNMVFVNPSRGYYQFTPAGDSKKLNLRKDYTEEERKTIDRFWSHHWAAGEESDEAVEERKKKEEEEKKKKEEEGDDGEDMSDLMERLLVNFRCTL